MGLAPGVPVVPFWMAYKGQQDAKLVDNYKNFFTVQQLE